MGADIKIIAFNAIPGTDKSTVAEALATRQGYAHLCIGDATRAALAGLEYHLELFTNWTLKELPREDMYGLSPRQLMIRLGAWGRFISPSLWIDRMQARAPRLTAGWVIADVGTEGEDDFVRLVLGGPIVRPQRTGVEPIPDRRVLVDPDHTFSNDGSLKSSLIGSPILLRMEARSVIRKLIINA
jgi:hypothetical protein